MIDLEMLNKQLDVTNKLKDMFAMQILLNEDIFEKHKDKQMTEENLSFAIIDEIGELTHELKGDWCWWKNTQAPVNRQRVLEELVDIWHFVITWQIEYTDWFPENLISRICCYLKGYYFEATGEIGNIIGGMMESYECKIHYLFDLTLKLGFTFDEVYQEYLKKNKENYKRLKEGY